MLSHITRRFGASLLRFSPHLQLPPSSHIATSSAVLAVEDFLPIPKRWPQRNQLRYDPQGPDEPIRRAYYCHVRDNIKYSPKKMWYVCCLIRGLTIDEAVKQLTFVDRKGALIAKEVLLEAQDIAMKEHNFEFKSNMFIGECFCTKGLVIKGFRKHAFERLGEVRYFHSHFFVKLVEGPPPKNYYLPAPLTGKEKLEQYIEGLRKRNIKFSL